MAFCITLSAEELRAYLTLNPDLYLVVSMLLLLVTLLAFFFHGCAEYGTPPLPRDVYTFVPLIFFYSHILQVFAYGVSTFFSWPTLWSGFGQPTKEHPLWGIVVTHPGEVAQPLCLPPYDQHCIQVEQEWCHTAALPQAIAHLKLLEKGATKSDSSLHALDMSSMIETCTFSWPVLST